ERRRRFENVREPCSPRAAADGGERSHNRSRLAPRNPCGHLLGPRQPAIARVTAEELVGSLASDSDGHPTPCEGSEGPQGNERLIRDRLVSFAEISRYVSSDVRLGERELVVQIGRAHV